MKPSNEKRNDLLANLVLFILVGGVRIVTSALLRTLGALINELGDIHNIPFIRNLEQICISAYPSKTSLSMLEFGYFIVISNSNSVELAFIRDIRFLAQRTLILKNKGHFFTGIF